MQWYYLSDSHERIAISEAQLAPLAARGTVRPATPVWRKGMADWAVCGEVLPQIFAAGIARDSDQRNPLADNAAVRGTVIGISRTIAGYNGWFRILGFALFLPALAGLAGTGYLTWLWLSEGTKALHLLHILPGFASDDPLLLWILAAAQGITALAGILAGWSLLRAASLAKQARESGNEHNLNAAIHSLGRYFVIAVSMLLFGLILWLSLILWTGWDKAFPKAPQKSQQSVVL